MPAAESVLYGVKPVVIAVVAQALWGLGRTAIKSRTLAALAVGATVAAAAGVHELIILAACGAVMALARGVYRTVGGSGAAGVALLAGPNLITLGGTAAPAAVPVNLGPLFGVFVKVGAVLFGSGYVLLAFLRADLVERLGWLTERQLLDAVAVGQITPGPVFTTATFIGYVLRGWPGALVATVGIFLPAFVFVAVSVPLIPRMRRSPTVAAALDGVNAASLALMAVVTWQLGRAALVDPFTTLLAAVSLLLLLDARINSAWLVLGGALAGAAARSLMSPV